MARMESTQSVDPAKFQIEEETPDQFRPCAGPPDTCFSPRNLTTARTVSCEPEPAGRSMSCMHE